MGLELSPEHPAPSIGVRQTHKGVLVKFTGLVLIWCILFVLSWPLALAALILAPLVWLISLPFRLIGISVGAAFALLKSILFLPARLLGYRG
jgi:hypothetical protein